MNKKDTKVLEAIMNNCSAMSDETQKKVMWITEGMALVGGSKDGKQSRR